MNIIFITFCRSIHSLLNISKTNIMNKNKCYLRFVGRDERIDLSFLYNVNNTPRQFNFSRKSSETLESLCMRIATNINKFNNKKSKKKGSDSSPVFEVNVNICDNNSIPISKDCTCVDLLSYQNLILRISDTVYEIVLNAPWIINFNLPKSILVGFQVYPENLETLNTKRRLSVFNWYRGKAFKNGNKISDEHIQWEFLINSFYYTPTVNDIGMTLRLECIPVNKESVGPAVQCITKGIVEAGPGPCPFEARHLFTSKILSGKSFRCVSYNILADLYCDSDFSRSVLHPYCPPYALHIDYRKQLIIKELKGYNSDILCLQEVDSKIFYSCLKPILENEGLNGLFYKKGKSVAEGLSCFYRRDRFKFIGDEQILLAEAVKSKEYLKSIWNGIQYNKPLLDRLLDRSTVASATFLESIENPNEIIIIGNTHLYFHPDADHIRLLQGGIVIYWLRYVKNKLKKQFPNKRVSLILGGDFNSVPSCGIYQLFTTGSAPSSLLDWKSNENEAVIGLSLSQDIHLLSACGTPQYTNYTQGFGDCLDYIFYEKTNLKVEQVVPLPSLEELKANIALPSIVFPSDHIAIISDLQFIDSTA